MNIFESNNYKSLLKGLIDERRKNEKGLSRKLSEHLGVHPTLVSQSIVGTKDFSEEQLLSVCEFLGLGKLETKFLLALLQKERAGSQKLKNHFQETIDQLRIDALKIGNRSHPDKKLKSEEEAIFYSSWVYSAVHIMTTLDKKTTFEKIVKNLNLPASKIREVVDYLISIQMIELDGTTLKTGARATHLDRNSPFLSKHHTNWRLKAIQRTEDISDEELMYTANFSVSEKDFAVLREQMMQTIQRFLAIVKDSPAENIAQFNLDLFWLKN